MLEVSDGADFRYGEYARPEQFRGMFEGKFVTFTVEDDEHTCWRYARPIKDTK